MERTGNLVEFSSVAYSDGIVLTKNCQTFRMLVYIMNVRPKNTPVNELNLTIELKRPIQYKIKFKLQGIDSFDTRGH